MIRIAVHKQALAAMEPSITAQYRNIPIRRQVHVRSSGCFKALLWTHSVTCGSSARSSNNALSKFSI